MQKAATHINISVQADNSARPRREEEEQNNSALSSNAVYVCAHNMCAFLSVAFLSGWLTVVWLIKLCLLCCRRAIHEASREDVATSQKH